MIGILMWLFSYSIPNTLLYGDYNEIGLAPKIFTCLLPNMAMAYGFRVIGMFEGRALGVQWSNLWETGNPRDELTMGMILLMLVLDTLLFLLVVWYVDQVSPGKYGVPRPFYFPFQRSYWCCARPSDSVADNPSSGSEEHHYFEEEPEGLEPGIVIRNLRKEFRTLGGKVKVAVENVSMTCYEGQCTVLLGHNGAGKTTTMSVLTGVYAPSGGQAEVGGWNIATHLREARMELGLCPQHNMLFVDLTVLQHLLFFGRLKGLTTKAAHKEAEVLMGRLDLLQKKHMFGKQLSGGMKRKLSLAISLIGGSKVVILDEPSSGLDPESRRWVWDVVQGERGRRTILVTTHHMEEADVLGDRVAIMATGRVICAGSTLFLKHKFGDGYTLEMIVKEECNLQVLTDEVARHIPDAALHKSEGGEVTFRLPPDTAQYAPLVESLACHKDRLGIIHFGLSLTTMERVFLRVSEVMSEEDERRLASNPSLEDGTEGTHHVIDEAKIENEIGASSQQYLYNSQTSNQIRLTGWSLFLNRIKATFIKRAIYLLRKWPLFITQGLVPVVVTIVCLLIDSNTTIFTDQEQPLPLTLSTFPETFSYVKDGQDLKDLTSKYKTLFSGSHTVEETQNITSSLLQAADKNLQNFREKHISSASFVDREDHIALKAWVQTIPNHAVGVGTSLVTNALLRSATNSNVHTITTINHPLPQDTTWQFSVDFSSSTMIYPVLMSLALSFLSASFLVFPHQERVSNSKQVQVMTGTPVWVLWAINFIWDLAIFCVTLLLIFICFMSLNSRGHFTTGAAPGALVLLLLLFGWGSIPMAYVFSFPFHTAAAGFAALTFISIITGQLVTAVVTALKFGNDVSLNLAADIIHWIASIIPVYSVATGFARLVKTSVHNAKCDVFDETTTKLLCEHLHENPSFNYFLQCCLNPPLCENSTSVKCFEKWSYFAFNDEGLGQILLVLFVNGLIFLLLIVMIEMGILTAIRQLWQKLTCKKTLPVHSGIQLPTDEDVTAETHLVSNLIAGNDKPRNEIKPMERSSGNMLLVHHLTKQYSKCVVRSVDDISFRVGKGECLGLLGVNGAGKTTTFKMLTGEEVPTAGDAKIGNLSLSHHKRNFLQSIGYCPQFDAFIEELTGVEMLHLMGRLRGLSSDQLKETVKSMVRQVGLVECARRPSSTYSGGNRRKLSTAMALIGDPPLVFLDEPTSGVDPASRRRVWAAISQAASSGQSVVLTSHSMEECEALCSRIIIMSRGTLRCVGTSGHLKAKFGQGYSLQVKLKTHGFDKNGREADEYMYNVKSEDLKRVIRAHLPGITLTDQHKGMLSYWVPTSVTWAQLFSVMESLKAGHNPDTNATDATHTMSTPSIVEAYAASDTSLEQVFLAFAREASQLEDRAVVSHADHTIHTARGPNTQQQLDITTEL